MTLVYFPDPTAIDVMVDPDGTLDVLADLGLTSPLLADQRTSPGAQQGLSAGLPPRTDGPAGQPYAASDTAERDPGLHVVRRDSEPASREEQPPVRQH